MKILIFSRIDDDGEKLRNKISAHFDRRNDRLSSEQEKSVKSYSIPIYILAQTVSNCKHTNKQCILNFIASLIMNERN